MDGTTLNFYIAVGYHEMGKVNEIKHALIATASCGQKKRLPLTKNKYRRLWMGVCLSFIRKVALSNFERSLNDLTR